MAGFIKLVIFLSLFLMALGAYIHYSTGPLHTRFDPMLTDLLSWVGYYIPGLSPNSN